ncbi:MAG: hypothetical protein RXQ22_08875, partial [Sulfolobus sp.]
SLIIVTGNYNNINEIKKTWNFLKFKFNCSFIPSARGILICTSKIQNEIKYYEDNGVLKQLLQNMYKNKLFNKLMKIYFDIMNRFKM